MAPNPRLTILDGSASIGGTKILLEQGETRLLLDFGTNYKTMGSYFEEFLQPRPSRGLVDLIEVGLLPRRKGLYRPDLFPSHDYPEKDRTWEGSPTTAVLLTHGHLDHCGAIAYLAPEIPIVATGLTLALLRSWQETGGSSVASEITYYGRRGPAEGKGRGGSLPGRLLAADSSVPRKSRDFRILGEVPSPLVERLRRSPVSEKAGFEPVDPTSAPASIGDIRIRHHEVDHSVYGASGFLLELDGALVAYSGDLRFHGERGPATEGFVGELEARSPDILIVEGTRLTSAEGTPTPPTITEHEVEENCRRKVERFEGRFVVADFGPRNIERLRSFRRIALA
ncbi:MAG: MBL fold metallo-hydrolase, partial [Thermoplasmata archaeon]|nr:MBL fold metallo-hydrolase [Thermoplasmata archaeon]